MWYFSVSWCVDHFTIVSKQGFSHLRIENFRKIGQLRKEIVNEKDYKRLLFWRNCLRKWGEGNVLSGMKINDFS